MIAAWRFSRNKQPHTHKHTREESITTNSNDLGHSYICIITRASVFVDDDTGEYEHYRMIIMGSGMPISIPIK